MECAKAVALHRFTIEHRRGRKYRFQEEEFYERCIRGRPGSRSSFGVTFNRFSTSILCDVVESQDELNTILELMWLSLSLPGEMCQEVLRHLPVRLSVEYPLSVLMMESFFHVSELERAAELDEISSDVMDIRATLTDQLLRDASEWASQWVRHGHGNSKSPPPDPRASPTLQGSVRRKLCDLLCTKTGLDPLQWPGRRWTDYLDGNSL